MYAADRFRSVGKPIPQMTSFTGGRSKSTSDFSAGVRAFFLEGLRSGIANRDHSSERSVHANTQFGGLWCVVRARVIRGCNPPDLMFVAAFTRTLQEHWTTHVSCSVGQRMPASKKEPPKIFCFKGTEWWKRGNSNFCPTNRVCDGSW